MPKENETSAPLRFWMKKRGITQAELAEKAGLAQNYISQIHTGSRSGSIEAIKSIADALGLSLSDFFACADPDEKEEIIFVPLVAAMPRAGTGGLDTNGEFERWYSFHSSFLARKRGTAETMRLFRVDGDSMEPLLFSKDMIMVNTSEAARHVVTGGVYLLRMGDELMVKRLERRPGNMLLIRSDNPNYEDIPVNMNEADGEIEIFGRMVWSCREY